MKKVIIFLMLISSVCLLSLMLSCGSHEHGYDVWQTIIEATCEEKGYQYRECSCGEKEYRYIDALGHEGGEWQTILEPTCERFGLEKLSCKNCHCFLEFNEIERLTTHELPELNIKPTCTKEATQICICSCGEKTEIVYLPSLGGHIDQNNDLICDVCEDKLFSVPVQLNLQGNATATVDSSVLIGETSGGIVSVTMGENSIFREKEIKYSRRPGDPEYVAGNIVSSPMNYVEPYKLENLTKTYQFVVLAENPVFGKPQNIVLQIADLTKTAVVVVNQQSYDNSMTYGQHYLFWGNLIDENDTVAMNDPNNKTSIIARLAENQKFIMFTDLNGDILSTDISFELILTKPITYINAYGVKKN